MEVAPFKMEVAPFFVEFHNLRTFVAIYIMSRFTHFFRNFFFGQNSLLRNITRFLHVWIDIFFTASASTGLSDLFSHKHTYYFKWIKVWLMTAIDWKHFKIEICNVRTYLRPLWCPSFSGSCTPEFQPEKSTSKRFQYCCLKKDTFERTWSSCSPWVFRMLAHNEERNRCHPSTRR